MSVDVRELNGDGEIDILEYWYVLTGRKRFIVLITAVAFAVAVIVSLLLPVRYSATASILPPQEMSSQISAFASVIPGDLKMLAGGLLGGNHEASTWIGILKSNNVKDVIIKSFGLMDVYGKDTVEETSGVLNSNLTVVMSKKDSIISVTVEDSSPERAAAMANSFIEGLDRVNKTSVMNSGQRMRLFVESRLVEARIGLSNAEDRLMRFQEKNKAVKLDAQSAAIIESIGTLKGELIAREVELSTLLSYATHENPQVQILKAQVAGLKGQLMELEVGKAPRSGSLQEKNIIIPTDYIPNLSLEYARLFREAKIQEILYELLTEQREIARIQEARDTSTVQILDFARVPEKKSKPKRTAIVLAVTISAFCFSIFLAIFMDYLDKVKVRRV